MSKSENHWYLVGATAQMRRAARPRATWLTLAVWVALIALFVFFYQAFSTSSDPLETGVPRWFPWPGLLWIWGVFFAGFLAFVLVRQRQMRAAYRSALQSPTLEPLLEAIERTMRLARAHPDVEALRAHARAQAFALYGRGDEALQELEAVAWATRAPLVQALGLSGEYIQVLLCQGDARRALELARQAQGLSSLGAAVPGAAQTARAYAAYAAIAEAMLGAPSPEARALLERTAADGRFPPLQLLASRALAFVCEREGDLTRAAQLRDFLQRTAPHCAPLHGAAPAALAPAAQGPVSRALASAPPAPEGRGPQARAAQRSLLKSGGRLVGLYLVLIALFVLFYVYFSQ